MNRDDDDDGRGENVIIFSLSTSAVMYFDSNYVVMLVKSIIDRIWKLLRNSLASALMEMYWRILQMTLICIAMPPILETGGTTTTTTLLLTPAGVESILSLVQQISPRHVARGEHGAL
jgi:hypothetical protein